MIPKWVPSPRLINAVTNVIGFLLAILVPVKAYFTSQPFDWTTFGLCIGGALLAYFTGKSGISTQKMLIAKGIILDPKAKGGLIDISNAMIGEEATTLFSTGIFLGTKEGRDILASISAGIKSEKGKLLIDQWKKLSGTQ